MGVLRVYLYGHELEERTKAKYGEWARWEHHAPVTIGLGCRASVRRLSGYIASGRDTGKSVEIAVRVRRVGS